MEVQPSDVGMFSSVQDAVRDALRGTPSARQTPGQVSAALSAMVDRAEATLAEALMASDGGEPGSEDAARQLRGVALDVRVHAQLARYHAAKREAAEALAFFYATGDLDSLLAARPGVEAALVAWQRLVALTDGVYHDDLIFGTPGEQRGHWKDHLVYAERDVARVDEVERVFRRYGLFDYAFDFGAAQTGRRSTPPMPYLDDYAVERRFTAVGPKSVYEDTVGWGWAGTYGKSAREAPAPGGGTLRAAVPNPKDLPREPLYSDFVLRHPAANYDNATFFVDVPDGDYEVVVILADRSAQPVDHGPMTVIFQGGTALGPVRVPAGEIVELRQRVAVACGRLELELNAPPAGRLAADGPDGDAGGAALRPPAAALPAAGRAVGPAGDDHQSGGAAGRRCSIGLRRMGRSSGWRWT